MASVVDLQQRLDALDPMRSFCVTAPAGSGKTELLIQRYLTVLARVEEPEQVLAITFTRKAAAEMRQRILDALSSADQEPPEDAHKAKTWELAREVLDLSDKRDWHILKLPARLNIRTIDSWCAYLTRHLPILSSFGGASSPVDGAERYYRQAVSEFLALIASDHWIAEDISRVMLHFDNNWQQLEDLLVRMLANREKWLPHFGTGLQVEAVESILESGVTRLRDQHISDLLDSIGVNGHELLSIFNYAQDNLSQPAIDASTLDRSISVDEWRSIVGLLLTKQGSWRKTVNVKTGFPAGKGIAAEWKNRFISLSETLQGCPELLPKLQLAMQLPEHNASGMSWQVLNALARLLPVLAAQLMITFRQEGVVDHAQVAIGAREALGPDDAITDLAMKLDYRLKHILVDEFQDTSRAQFELLRRLTRNWVNDNNEDPMNPNTLFVVGDGMQSIYGFRDADVSLFSSLRHHGLNGLSLQPATLQTNFRSDAVLVDWVSEVFPDAFPSSEDMNLGAIPFSASQPFHEASETSAVSMVAVDLDEPGARYTEAAALVRIIQQGMADETCQSIAVLARTRSQFLSLVELLKQHDIPWSAQDVDSLAVSPVVIDLLNLLKALHNKADDVAWLAILRAPWCGLHLDALHEMLANRGESTVWEVIQSSQECFKESSNEYHQIKHLIAVLASAETLRERLPLRRWLEHIWLLLGGPSVASTPELKADARDFFDLLETLDGQGVAYLPSRLEQEVERLFSASGSGQHKLQLMTLHKSKGLEFDWVIIPGLDYAPAADRREILLLDEFNAGDQSATLLFAADDRSDEEFTLYNWLNEKQKMKRELEVSRLLYVGTTRAVKRLFLSAGVKLNEEGEWRQPGARSLLSRIWSSFEEHAVLMPSASNKVVSPPRQFRRLTRSKTLELHCESVDSPNTPEPDPGRLSRTVGTLVHLTLERLSSYNSHEIKSIDLRGWESWWSHYLAQRLDAESVSLALSQVDASLRKVLSDDKGCWLLANERQEAASELPLSRIDDQGRLREMVVDRTFVEDSTRWLVDYKSASPNAGESLEDFLREQEDRHRSQLLGYAKALSSMGPEPVKIALYFTSLPLWHECRFE